MNISNQWVSFNSMCTLDIDGMLIEHFLPDMDTPQRRVTVTPISGRSGDLRVLEKEYGQDVYDSIEKTVDYVYVGTDIKTFKKFCRGDGNLILSNNPDRYWKASIDNKISPATVSDWDLREFTLVYKCYPYAYLNIGAIPIVYEPTTQTWETILMNDYDLALPHIKIYGQGDIGVMVNGTETDFDNVVGFVECDTEMQETYNDTQNLGMNMVGTFPILSPGENDISFTGNITKVELTPNWREL